MILRFASREMERICTDDRYMQRKLGSVMAKSLRLRVAELVYAERLSDLVEALGRWEALKGDRQGQWSARLSANWRIVVEPLGDVAPATVLVIEIVDYHQG